MSDTYLDETIIYSADVWPSVSVGMPEVQAHAMSCPQAQGEYAAADRVLELQAEVQRLSSELAHRTQVWEGEEWKLRAELSDARAEIVSLLEEVARLRGCAPVSSCQSIKTASPAATLDHRLGLPQPDGDPVEPMSAKKPYRWGAL